MYKYQHIYVRTDSLSLVVFAFRLLDYIPDIYFEISTADGMGLFFLFSCVERHRSLASVTSVTSTPRPNASEGGNVGISTALAGDIITVSSPV